jgi:hypothetical protein
MKLASRVYRTRDRRKVVGERNEMKREKQVYLFFFSMLRLNHAHFEHIACFSPLSKTCDDSDRVRQPQNSISGFLQDLHSSHREIENSLAILRVWRGQK